jgi:putative addiction module component (TIGR02574 family)
MIRTLPEVERDALALPPQDRAVLAEHLLATLAPGEDVDAEEEWVAEAERRYQEYRAGRVGAKPAAEVFDRARRALR